jgi:hypothetical protein
MSMPGYAAAQSQACQPACAQQAAAALSLAAHVDEEIGRPGDFLPGTEIHRQGGQVGVLQVAR